jgi:hypothetical protein
MNLLGSVICLRVRTYSLPLGIGRPTNETPRFRYQPLPAVLQSRHGHESHKLVDSGGVARGLAVLVADAVFATLAGKRHILALDRCCASRKGFGRPPKSLAPRLTPAERRTALIRLLAKMEQQLAECEALAAEPVLAFDAEVVVATGLAVDGGPATALRACCRSWAAKCTVCDKCSLVVSRCSAQPSVN